MRRMLITGAVAVSVAIGLGLMTADSPFSRAVRANDHDALDCPVQHGALRSALVAADTADTTGLDNGLIRMP